MLNTAGAVHETYDRPVSRVLREVRGIVRSGGTLSTIVQPTVFMDNLVAPWALPSLLNDGVMAYPGPAANPISWISHTLLVNLYGVKAVPRDFWDARRVSRQRANAKTDRPERLSNSMGLRTAHAAHCGDTVVCHLPLAPAGDIVVPSTAHLRELERDGIVRRKVFAVVPPSVEYSLTETGCSLWPILSAMADWGTAYRGNQNTGVA